jgi:maltooligosyltrehalose trehalohydrolase
VGEGRRREFAAFGWNPDDIPDPQDTATFERSRLDWGELEEPSHRRVLEWYRTLIAFRRKLPVHRGPVGEGVRVELDDRERRLVFDRDGVSVWVNLGDADWHPSVPADRRLVMASEPGVRIVGGSISLPPCSLAILELTRSRG